MKRYLFPLLTGALLLSACSSKQYFEPEQTYDVTQVESSYSGTIIDKRRNGVTLDNGHYIDRSGISKIRLEEGFRFLNETGKYVLAGNGDGVLALVDKHSGKVIKRIELHEAVVSANMKNGLIAYILSNNAFGLYRLKDNKKLVENRAEQTFAIDTRAADPLFIDTLVVMPMLDGKLVIFDIRDPETAKVVYLSSDKVFNNVIFLSRTGDTLVAATPKRLLTIGAEGEFAYSANIAEVTIFGNKIYLFTKEGEIVKLNIMLEKLAAKKFKFAQFSAATVTKGKVYALDKQGSLIVMDSDLKHAKIYDVGEVDTPVFIAGNRLYKDGKIIRLDKLGYK